MQTKPSPNHIALLDREDYSLIGGACNVPTIVLVNTLRHLDRMFAYAHGPKLRQIDNTMDQIEKELIRRSNGQTH